MDYVPEPNVITTLTIKKINFTFRVHAYRTLNAAEMRFALRKWMDDTRHKKIPSNKTIDYCTIHGFDSQAGL